MRLIDADALQEALTRKKAGIANQRWTEGFNAAISKAKSMVSCAKTIDAEPIRTTMSEWISVKDRLPELLDEVLLFTSEGDIFAGVFFERHENYTVAGDYHRFFYDVTHWMPLPEPPNEG